MGQISVEEQGQEADEQQEGQASSAAMLIPVADSMAALASAACLCFNHIYSAQEHRGAMLLHKNS